MSIGDAHSEFGEGTTTIDPVPSREFVLEGVTFSWWAIGERPAFVTVSSPVYGTKSAMTGADAEALACAMARALLAETSEQEHPIPGEPGPG